MPTPESMETNPVSPYGISKLMTEKYAFLYQYLHGLPALILRPSNPYGPLQNRVMNQGFIGKLLDASRYNLPITIYGDDGGNIRDYIYIEDLAKGIIAAARQGRVGQIYNLGTGIGYTNLDVVGLVERLLGIKIPLIREPRRPFDVRASILCTKKSSSESGWRYETSLQDGLKKTFCGIA